VVRKESSTKYIERQAMPTSGYYIKISIHILLHKLFKLLEKAFHKARSNIVYPPPKFGEDKLVMKIVRGIFCY